MSDPDNPVQVFTIGEQGPPGPPPITTLAAIFTMPAIGSSAVATVESSGFVVAGQGLLLAGGGYLLASSPSPGLVILTNLGGTNAAPGTNFAPGTVLGLAGTVPALIYPTTTGALALAAVQAAIIPVNAKLGGFPITMNASPTIGATIEINDADSTGTYLTNNPVKLVDPNGYPFATQGGQGGPWLQGFTINQPGFVGKWRFTIDALAANGPQPGWANAL
jgi:hypothetical protein